MTDWKKTQYDFTIDYSSRRFCPMFLFRSLRDYLFRRNNNNNNNNGPRRELLWSICWFCFGGWIGPQHVLKAIMGGVNVRAIPYQITNAGDVLLDLSLANEYVDHDSVTVNTNTLLFVSIWLPLVFLSIMSYTLPLRPSTPIQNTHAVICTLLCAIGTSEALTTVLKLYVGRLRPNFYRMCGFDPETLACTRGSNYEMEARMSFPSGHSSLVFCGMTVLSLVLLGRVGMARFMTHPRRYNNSSGSNMTQPSLAGLKPRILLALSPILPAVYVASSRLVDNWHHPSDVLAGMVLGSFCGFVVYHLWFPNVFSPFAGVPLLSLVVLDGNKQSHNSVVVVSGGGNKT